MTDEQILNIVDECFGRAHYDMDNREWICFARALLASSALDRPSAGQEREAFEAWFPHLDNSTFIHEGLAAYCHVKMQGAWEGWQARAALNAPARQSAENPCVGCEGKPSHENSPCAVYGLSAENRGELDYWAQFGVAPPSQAENRGEEAKPDAWLCEYGNLTQAEIDPSIFGDHWTKKPLYLAAPQTEHRYEYYSKLEKRWEPLPDEDVLSILEENRRSFQFRVKP